VLAFSRHRAPSTCKEDDEQHARAGHHPVVHQGAAFDKDRLAGLLPGSKDALAKQRRAALFARWDPNGNGVLSLAEVDKGIEELLGSMVPKPAIHRAFYAARRIAPPVADHSDDFIDFNEFRLFNVYLRHYLELWHWFAAMDADADRRVSLAEFREARCLLQRWGCRAAFEAALTDPDSVFHRIDKDGGGLVLFDEFAHWVLNHCEELFEAGDAKDRSEALAMLQRKPANLCAENENQRMYAVPRPLAHRGVPKLPVKQSAARATALGSARGAQRGKARSVSAAQSSSQSRVRSGSPVVLNRSRENSPQPRSTNASRATASRGSRSREASVENRSDISISSARTSARSTPEKNASELNRGRPPKQTSKARPRGGSSEGQMKTSCASRAWASASPDSRSSPSACHQLHSAPSPSTACRSSPAVTAAASTAPGRGSGQVCSQQRSQTVPSKSTRSSSLPPPRLPPVISKKPKGAGAVHVLPKAEVSRDRLRQHTGCTRARMEAFQKPATPKRFRQALLGPIPGWRRC